MTRYRITIDKIINEKSLVDFDLEFVAGFLIVDHHDLSTFPEYIKHILKQRFNVKNEEPV